MDLTRFVWSLFVTVLAVGIVTPSPVCNCKTAHNLNLSEQSCLLNHLLHIISHLVSCGGQQPLEVSPEKYKQLLEVTNCSQKTEAQTITEPPTTEATTPKGEESTTVSSLKWLTPTETIPESSSEVSSSESTSTEEDYTLSFPSGISPYIPLYTTTIVPDSSESSSGSSETETTSGTVFTLPPRVAETSSATPPPATVPPPLITDILPVPTLFPLPETTTTTPEEPELTTLPIFQSPPSTFPPPPPPPSSEPTTTPSPKKMCEESGDKHGLNFHAETFFIPVLKFHGGPCMSAQELRDYLFRCIPNENKIKSS